MKANAASKALIIVDMINRLDFPQGTTLGRRAVEAAKRTAALKRRYKAAGAAVIYANDNFGDWETDFRALVEECAQGRGGELVELLRPDDDDYYVLKPRHSAFHYTPLPAVLAQLCAADLVICGVATDICVLASAIDARVHGYSVAVPADCSQAQSESRHRDAIALLSKSFQIPVASSRSIRV